MMMMMMMMMMMRLIMATECADSALNALACQHLSVVTYRILVAHI
jgi:hypothetical protein